MLCLKNLIYYLITLKLALNVGIIIIMNWITSVAPFKRGNPPQGRVTTPFN